MENYIIPIGFTHEGKKLTQDQCTRLFSLPGDINKSNIDIDISQEIWQNSLEKEKKVILLDIEERNSNFFDDEMKKLDNWADDLKKGLETEIKNLDRDIKQQKREAKKIVILKEKLKIQRQIKDMEKKRKEKRAKLYEEQDSVEKRKEDLIDNIEKRLKQKIEVEEIFKIQWNIK